MTADSSPEVQHATRMPDFSDWNPITQEEMEAQLAEIESEILRALLRSNDTHPGFSEQVGCTRVRPPVALLSTFAGMF